MARKTSYYYRIYDDKEQFNYIRSSLQEKRIRGMLRKYEQIHQQYYNEEFVEFLRKSDRTAELIEVNSISY